MDKEKQKKLSFAEYQDAMLELQRREMAGGIGAEERNIEVGRLMKLASEAIRKHDVENKKSG